MSFMVRSAVAKTMPTEMDTETVLSTLIASRICHDLASPMGAVNNGVELLELSSSPAREEMSLLKSSITAASGRLELLRIAFGQASPEQSMSAERVSRTLALISKEARISYDWSGAGHVPRQELQLALLGAMCIEVTIPRGGKILMTSTDGAWSLQGTGPQVVFDHTVWAKLKNQDDLSLYSATDVQFALLPRLAEGLGRSVSVQGNESAVTVMF